MKAKACAIVLRKIADGVQVLLFRHPLAGVQLVKGGIQPGETPAQAAVRELFEEGGLKATGVTEVHVIDFAECGQRWHICLCDVGSTPNSWVHDTFDDDGQRFAFFWHSVDAALPTDMGTPYREVLRALQSAKVFST